MDAGYDLDRADDLISGSPYDFDVTYLEVPALAISSTYLRMRAELTQPSVQVHYRREAYIYGPGNVRVTLDSDIRTGLWDVDFLSPAQPRIRTQSDDFVLLEVKFDCYLPDIIRDITCCQCRPMSFSKFEACHSYD